MSSTCNHHPIAASLYHHHAPPPQSNASMYYIICTLEYIYTHTHETYKIIYIYPLPIYTNLSKLCHRIYIYMNP